MWGFWTTSSVPSKGAPTLMKIRLRNIFFNQELPKQFRKFIGGTVYQNLIL